MVIIMLNNNKKLSEVLEEVLNSLKVGQTKKIYSEYKEGNNTIEILAYKIPPKVIRIDLKDKKSK